MVRYDLCVVHRERSVVPLLGADVRGPAYEASSIIPKEVSLRALARGRLVLRQRRVLDIFLFLGDYSVRDEDLFEIVSLYRFYFH